MTSTLDPARPAQDRAELQQRLADVMIRDRRRLGRRLNGIRKVRNAQAREKALHDVAGAVDDAQARVERRRAAVPKIAYPALPVSERRDEIAAAIRDNQVVIVAGETGSGKTTQLPKICLELGRGVIGTIGHTQPRRIAARATAERIAEELSTELGSTVGYQVRFGGSVSQHTLVKLMTDGILLAEIQSDRLLEQYDTLIIDEAHERSLNIDFLLGYVKQLLPRRPDLKVVITSATIDPQRFSRHFGDAPVIEVSGRTYPVEVRYRPLVEDADGPDGDETADGAEPRDQVQAILDAVDELSAEGPGDILVFLSGEREIRDTTDALRDKLRREARAGTPETEVLPLYARLSAAEQHRVFAPHRVRRIVLATNVAETSLTVPGIRYVVDPGTARISRYSTRLKVQRLPIEPISQASANQRAGRCGRTADGICLRLYAEEDFEARPAFTDPEILRTNLAAVILQMAALGLGDGGRISGFPFLDPPDPRAVRDGVALLQELGALEAGRERQPAGGARSPAAHRLTPLGRRLAALPVDPRLARMIVEAGSNGCVREILIVTAALSIQDPRERPADAQQAADEQHRRFADPTSDFAAYLNLWTYLQDQQRELSSSAFRRLCKREYLHYLRVREWQDLYAQLRSVLSGLDLSLNSAPADAERVHRSLLAGLLSQIGLWDPEKREYAGARGARFAIFPGSGLARKNPRWVMAAELVETSRLWARDVAKIEPEWVEPLAGHLVKRTYSEPHWDREQGAVIAYERVTLYGVPIVARRKVNYGGIDPELSRELFVRHALVEGDWEPRPGAQHAFWFRNRDLIAEVEQLESRVRRRDLLVDDETLFAFYDERVPADVVSLRHFDAWWTKTRRESPDLLTFDPAMLIRPDAGEVRVEDYPVAWQQGDLALPLSYAFEPGAPRDGVTVHIPLAVLNRVSAAGFDWQVPGLRLELVTALIRSLPKALRVNFVPAPDHARAALSALADLSPAVLEGRAQPPVRVEPLTDALGRILRRRTGVPVPADAWDVARVPPHLRMTFLVEDQPGRGDRRAVGEGKDLGELQARLAGRMRAAVTRAAGGLERTGLRAWPGGELPRRVQQDPAGQPGGPAVLGYPALVDEGSAVAVRVLATPVEQRRAMWRGTRRLLLLSVPSPVRSVVARLATADKLAMSSAPHGSVAALLDDCLAASVDVLMAEGGGPAWTAEGFAVLRDRVRAELGDRLQAVLADVARILPLASDVRRRLPGLSSPTLQEARADVEAQVDGLVFAGFANTIGARRLPDVLRYLRAAVHRLDRLGNDPRGDTTRLARVRVVQQAYDELLASLPAARRDDPDVQAVRWRIEELRVSLFAQQLGTAAPVSEQRILREIAAIAR